MPRFQAEVEAKLIGCVEVEAVDITAARKLIRACAPGVAWAGNPDLDTMDIAVEIHNIVEVEP